MKKVFVFVFLVCVLGSGLYFYLLKQPSEVDVAEPKIVAAETFIVAPYHGVVAETFLRVGQPVKQGEALFSIATKEYEERLRLVRSNISKLSRQIPAEHLPYIDDKSLSTYFYEVKDQEEHLQQLVKALSVDLGKARLEAGKAGYAANECPELLAERDSAALLYKQAKEELEQVSNQRSYLEGLLRDAGSEANSSEYDLGQLLALYEKSMHEMNNLTNAIEQSIVRAPVDGVVGCLLVRNGDSVEAGQQVASVASADNKVVLIGMVPSAQADLISKGAPCAVDFADGQKVEGRVLSVGRENSVRVLGEGSRPAFGTDSPTMSNADAVREAIEASEGNEGELVPVEVEVFMLNPAGVPNVPVARARVMTEVKM